jgi:hypothetical protein
MKVNDLVVLKQKARKDFYETNKLIECYQVQGEIRSRDFSAFVNEYVGFISAETGLGVVADLKTYHGETTVKVEFQGPLGRDFHYFDIKELKVL